MNKQFNQMQTMFPYQQGMPDGEAIRSREVSHRGLVMTKGGVSPVYSSNTGIASRDGAA
jgi:hypothetical protein